MCWSLDFFEEYILFPQILTSAVLVPRVMVAPVPTRREPSHVIVLVPGLMALLVQIVSFQ